MMNGMLWAQQFQAPPFHSYRQTQNGAPMMPTVGGYGSTPNMPYMTAPYPLTRPAGAGPVELGWEGINRAFFLAQPRVQGRNQWGDTGRQGNKGRTVSVGVQGLSATAIRVR